MKNINIKFVLSAICLASFLPGLTKVNAAPVQFNEVIQFVSAKPGKASTGSFSVSGVSRLNAKALNGPILGTMRKKVASILDRTPGFW